MDFGHDEFVDPFEIIASQLNYEDLNQLRQVEKAARSVINKTVSVLTITVETIDELREELRRKVRSRRQKYYLKLKLAKFSRFSLSEILQLLPPNVTFDTLIIFDSHQIINNVPDFHIRKLIVISNYIKGLGSITVDELVIQIDENYSPRQDSIMLPRVVARQVTVIFNKPGFVYLVIGPRTENPILTQVNYSEDKLSNVSSNPDNNHVIVLDEKVRGG